MILAFAAVLSVFSSCVKEYDDTEIWKAIEELKSQISTLITVVEGSDGEYYWTADDEWLYAETELLLLFR